MTIGVDGNGIGSVENSDLRVVKVDVDSCGPVVVEEASESS